MPRTLIASLLLAALCLGALAAQGAPATARPAAPRASSSAEVQVRYDLQYAEGIAHDGRRNTLDYFCPAAGTAPPLVMFVHGGAWSGGSKDLFESVGRELARQGLACASINTRLVPFAKPRDMAADCARAFAWLHGRAGELGFDPARMFVMGHSSGAHLVAWLALDRELQAAHGVPPGAVRGVIALSGVYDVRPRHVVLDGVFGMEPAARAEASPLLRAHGDAPPFLVLWAEKELPGLALNARTLVHRLRACGATAEGCELRGIDHVNYMFGFGKDGDVVTPKVVGFVAAQGSAPAATAAAPLRPPRARAVRLVADAVPEAAGARIDLWLPDGAAADALLVMAAASAEQATAEQLAAALAQGGVAAAVVRCGPAAAIAHPASTRAFAGACRRLLDRGRALGVPMQNLFVGGSAAGGWLAAAAGLDGELLGRRPRGILLLGVPWAGAVRNVLPGLVPAGAQPPQLRTAMRADGPALLLLWGDRDPAPVVSDNRAVGLPMQELGSAHTAVELAGRDTATCLSQVGSADDEISAVVLAFLLQ